jgi:hypothetical protein
MVKETLPCFPLAAAQGLVPFGFQSYRTMKHLNNMTEKSNISNK